MYMLIMEVCVCVFVIRISWRIRLSTGPMLISVLYPLYYQLVNTLSPSLSLSSSLKDDPEDLHFNKGDRMVVLRKDEDEWWFARHEDGRSGSIPVPYIEVVTIDTLSIHVLTL